MYASSPEVNYLGYFAYTFNVYHITMVFNTMENCLQHRHKKGAI